MGLCVERSSMCLETRADALLVTKTKFRGAQKGGAPAPVFPRLEQVAQQDREAGRQSSSAALRRDSADGAFDTLGGASA